MYHMTYVWGYGEDFPQRTLKFATSDTFGYNPGYTVNLGSISNSLTESLELEPSHSNFIKSAHWIKFTVNSGTYSIFSSTHGTNSGIDVDAVLYKQEESSVVDGKNITMHMVEQDSDKNSGARNHFEMYTYLQTGTYFIRVVGGTPSASGYYKINIE